MDNSSAINLNSISFRSFASCGYCQGRKSSKLWVTSGFQCPKINCEAYQSLMDRGWRRCGLFYYLPHLFESCCQAYTIRLDTYNYFLKQSHQKVLRKIKNIQPLSNSQECFQGKQGCEEELTATKILQIVQSMSGVPAEMSPYLKDVKISMLKGQLQLKNVEIPILFDEINIAINQVNNKFCKNLIQNVDQLIQTIGDVPADKLCYVQQKLIQFIMDVDNNSKLYEGKNCSLASNLLTLFYANVQQLWQNELKVKLPMNSKPDIISLCQEILNAQQLECEIQVNVTRSNQLIFLSPQITNHRLTKMMVFRKILDYQRLDKKPIVQAQLTKMNSSQKSQRESPIRIEWEKAHFEQDSFDLYCNYQKIIHGKDHCSLQSYLSFLCQPAIEEKELTSQDGTTLDCGCWHMKYYLGSCLLAVGVIDILPQSVSSVYFFYDPNYKKYSLGVYGALKEIEFIQQKQKSFPLFQYYYLGFYIQDSSKMVYKGDYRNSDILCPVTLQWVSLTKQLRQQIDDIQESIQMEQVVPKELRTLKQGEFQINEQEAKENDLFIKSRVNLQVCQKTYKITELKPKFSDYMITLFQQLVPLMGQDLTGQFIFKYTNRGGQ